jgi:hypothetical protein
MTEAKYLSTADLAIRWSMTPVTLRRWRQDGKGPPWIRMGRVVKYAIKEVERYERENRGG